MDTTDLEGRFLIAMPGIGDSRFHRAVILICAHSDQGAMGLVVNQRSDSISFRQLLDQLDIEADEEENLAPPVRCGGPVEGSRGFVLHSGDFDGDGAMKIGDDLKLTGTIDILRAIAGGEGPQKHLITLGYTGWAPGQLEREIQDNGWLTCESQDDIIFGEADGDKWVAALGVMGISPELLSAGGGTA